MKDEELLAKKRQIVEPLVAKAIDVFVQATNIADQIDQINTEDLFKSVIYNKPRQKELKDTMSWSCNLLMRLYFLLKPKLGEAKFTLPEFVEKLKESNVVT